MNLTPQSCIVTSLDDWVSLRLWADGRNARPRFLAPFSSSAGATRGGKCTDCSAVLIPEETGPSLRTLGSVDRRDVGTTLAAHEVVSEKHSLDVSEMPFGRRIHCNTRGGS